MSSETMKIDPIRAAALVSQIQSVQVAIKAVSKTRPVRLVAVSKLKPANDILALHQDPAVKQQHFGENYTQELVQKAELLPTSIKWHFIGGLQSGHCKTLAKIPNLWSVSSVDTLKKAQTLSRVRADLISTTSPSLAPLNLHIQVNTSGEDNKSGCAPGADTVALCRAVREMPVVRLLGLMTIGAMARSRETTKENENEDFKVLVEQAEMVKRELGLEEDLELSMGMSEDFEGAIVMGSSEVRVGSMIFGARPPKAEAQLAT